MATREISAARLLFLYKVVALVFVLPFALHNFRIVSLWSLITVLIVNAFLNALAFYLYLRAISVSPLSVTVPMLSFSPVFLLFTSRLILGQKVNLAGISGIVLITVGSYLLNLGDVRRGPFVPILSLLKEPGARYMLTVAFIWSITANLDRIGVGLSDPFVWVALMNVGVISFVMPVALRSGSGPARWRFPIAMGVADGIGAVLQMFAITLAPVPHVIAIKRTSILLSSVVGLVVFRERRWAERFSGALAMAVGAVLVILSIARG